MKELNVNPKMFGLTVGGDLPEFYDLLKQNAEYIYGSTQWERVAAVSRAEGVPRRLQDQVQGAGARRTTPRPATRAACIYAEAVKKAGTLDADKVRDQLLKMEIKTAFGEYKVEPDGFQIAHKMVMLQWQDGKKHRGVAGRSGERQAALPDAGVEPAIAPRRARRVLRRARARSGGPVGVLITPSMVGQVVISGLLAGSLYAMVALGPRAHLRRDARAQRRPRPAPDAGRLHDVLALPVDRPQSRTSPCWSRCRSSSWSASRCSASWCAAWWTRPSCRRCCSPSASRSRW